MRTILTHLIVLAIMATPLVTAQDPADPLRRHADQKTAAATQDPVAFATDHATQEAIAREAEWGLAYGCFVVDQAHEEYGTPDPKLEQCEDYEEALGIEEEPQEELPQAIAENLTEEPVKEIKAVAEDAIATTERIVDEPTSAIDEALAFLGRVLGSAGRIVGGAIVLLIMALGAALDLATGLAETALGAISLIADSLRLATMTTASSASGSLDLASAVIDAVPGVADGLAAGIGQLANAVRQGLAATGSAIGNGIADAANALGDAIGDLIDSILGFEEGGSDQATPSDLRDLPVATDGLLPEVGKVVDELA